MLQHFIAFSILAFLGSISMAGEMPSRPAPPPSGCKTRNTLGILIQELSKEKYNKLKCGKPQYGTGWVIAFLKSRDYYGTVTCDDAKDTITLASQMPNLSYVPPGFGPATQNAISLVMQMGPTVEEPQISSEVKTIQVQEVTATHVVGGNMVEPTFGWSQSTSEDFCSLNLL